MHTTFYLIDNIYIYIIPIDMVIRVVLLCNMQFIKHVYQFAQNYIGYISMIKSGSHDDGYYCDS